MDLRHVEEGLEVNARKRVTVEEKGLSKGRREHGKDTKNAALDATAHTGSKARNLCPVFTERPPTRRDVFRDIHGRRTGHLERFDIDRRAAPAGPPQRCSPRATVVDACAVDDNDEGIALVKAKRT